MLQKIIEIPLEELNKNYGVNIADDITSLLLLKKVAPSLRYAVFQWVINKEDLSNVIKEFDGYSLKSERTVSELKKKYGLEIDLESMPDLFRLNKAAPSLRISFLNDKKVRECFIDENDIPSVIKEFFGFRLPNEISLEDIIKDYRININTDNKVDIIKLKEAAPSLRIRDIVENIICYFIDKEDLNNVVIAFNGYILGKPWQR